MFKEIADIKTADMLDLPVPKAVFHNISVKPSEIQRDMVDGLSGMAASNMGNIIKYLYRVGHKDDIKQDLDKAKQYIDFLYEDLQRKSN